MARRLFVLFMLYSLLSQAGLSAEATPAGAQISGPGGIGNTRKDVLRFWHMGSLDYSFADTNDDHLQFAVYDQAKYQFEFWFQLQNDDKERDEDRVIGLSVSYMDFVTIETAEKLVESLLPADAKAVGTRTLNRYGEPVDTYRSEAIATASPNIDIEGFGEPGTIWVVYFITGGRIGVFDIMLFDETA